LKHFLDRFFLFRDTPDPDCSLGKKFGYWAWRVFFLTLVSFCMGIALLLLARGGYSLRLCLDYIKSVPTLALNTLPVVLLSLLFYAITGLAWLGFLLGGGICFGFSLGNYYKLSFRDDPVYFEDLTVLREARTMAGGDHYSLFLDRHIIVVGICFIIGVLALYFFARGRIRGWKKRGLGHAHLLRRRPLPQH
jgi:hypothetical protein